MPNLQVISGFGPRTRPSGPVMGQRTDLAAIGDFCAPSSRSVRTTWRAGIALTGITLEYSESPLVPENLPLPSTDVAVELLNWMNEHTELEGGYDKTVIRCEWADGSVWRARFDVDGKWRTDDLFGNDHGGGITWANSTDKGKIYDRAAVLSPQTFADLVLSIQRWRRERDAEIKRQRMAVKAETLRVLTQLGVIPGAVYFREAHTDNTDWFNPARYWRYTEQDGQLVYEWMQASGGEVHQSFVRESDHFAYHNPMAFSTLTEYADLASVPKRVKLRDLAKELSGEQYPGAAVENRIIKTVLQFNLPKSVKVSVRANSGTAYGWSDISIDGATKDEKLTALDILGLNHIGGNERYHMDMPYDVAERVRARLAK
jgi:hypothetical protein